MKRMKLVLFHWILGVGLILRAENPQDSSTTISALKSEVKPEFTLSGGMGFYFELGQQPSSIRGQTLADFAFLQLSPEVKVNSDLSLVLRFELAEERSGTLKNYMSEMQNAFIRYRDHQIESLNHELGLFRSAWITEKHNADQLEFFGSSGESFFRRYDFVAEGDLGYQARYQGFENWLLVLSFANGEENSSAEQGPNKEAFIGGFYKTPDVSFQIGASSGRVDGIEAKTSQKNRVLLRAEKKWGRFLAGVEGLYAQDSSIDLENKGRIEGITFTELTEPASIKTYGGRLNLYYDLSDKERLVLRGDWVTPKSYKKRVQSVELAWIKQESKRMKWGVFYENTEFGAQHSSRSKHRELARLGLEVDF